MKNLTKRFYSFLKREKQNLKVLLIVPIFSTAVIFSSCESTDSPSNSPSNSSSPNSAPPATPPNLSSSPSAPLPTTGNDPRAGGNSVPGNEVSNNTDLLWYRLFSSAGVLFLSPRTTEARQVELSFTPNLNEKETKCGTLRLALIDTQNRKNILYAKKGPICEMELVEFLRPEKLERKGKEIYVRDLEDRNRPSSLTLIDGGSEEREVLLENSAGLEIIEREDGRIQYTIEISIKSSSNHYQKIPLNFFLDSDSYLAKEFNVASFNIENMRDPESDESDFSEYSKSRSNWSMAANESSHPFFVIKAKHIALALVLARTPEVVAMQEIENQEVFTNVLWPELEKIGYRYFHIATQEAEQLLKANMTTAIVSKFPISVGRELPYRGLDNRPSARNPQIVELLVGQKKLILYNTHWISRSFSIGDKEDEMRKERLEVARVIRADIDDYLQKDPDTDVILVGDFNEHYNQTFLDRRRFKDLSIITGIVEGLKATGDERKMVSSKNLDNLLYNLWYELPMEKRYSRFYQEQQVTLDQVFLSPALYDSLDIQYKDNSYRVVGQEFGIAAEVLTNANYEPLRWQIIRKKFEGEETFRYEHLGIGFSDHFPILATFLIPDRESDEKQIIRPSSIANFEGDPLFLNFQHNCSNFISVPLLEETYADSLPFFSFDSFREYQNNCLKFSGPLKINRQEGDNRRRWIDYQGKKIQIVPLGTESSLAFRQKYFQFLTAKDGVLLNVQGKSGWSEGNLALYIGESDNFTFQGGHSNSCVVGPIEQWPDPERSPQSSDLRCIEMKSALEVTSVRPVLMNSDLLDIKGKLVFPHVQIKTVFLRVWKKDLFKFLPGSVPENFSLNPAGPADFLKGKTISIQIKGLLESLEDNNFRINNGFLEFKTGDILFLQLTL